jgi:hypothetical protein
VEKFLLDMNDPYEIANISGIELCENKRNTKTMEE